MGWLKWGIGALVLVGAALFIGARVFSAQLGEAAFKRAFEANISRDLIGDLPDGLHVALVGSGSPLSDPTRMGPMTAIIAGERLFIVDAGGGAPRNLAPMGLPVGRVEAIFLTHFHSDHIDGLGELMLQRWANGANAEPVPVYGPDGVQRVVGGLNAAYALDAGYRVAHHGPDITPPGGTGGEPRAFSIASPLEPVVVLEDGGLTVTAFAVVHDPVHPAVGYRFDYGGRSVVLSGDTAVSEMLTAQARGADLLVHEALNAEMVGVMGEALAARGAGNLAHIMADIPTYHATPVEAAEAAEAAGVDMLVYSHIVPPLPTPALYSYFLRGVGEAYGGKTVVGEDGMLFTLEAGGEDVDFQRLK